MAAFMACGHAKFTGGAGVCLATSGPDAIHLLNGLYDAKMDRQPVVAIVGQQSRSALGGHYQQEVDLVSMFKDAASEYVQMVATAPQLRHVVDSAFRIALSEQPVVLEAIVDPNVPPLPPHITLEQARNYLKAILKGDPDAMPIIKASVKEMRA